MNENFIRIGEMRNMSPREIRVVYSHSGEWVKCNDIAKIMFGRDMAEAMVVTENSIKIHNITDVMASSSWSYPKESIKVVVFIPLSISEMQAEKLQRKLNDMGVDETWKWAYSVYANMLTADIQERNDIARELFLCLIDEYEAHDEVDGNWSAKKE